jgi:hypothetical protein
VCRATCRAGERLWDTAGAAGHCRRSRACPRPRPGGRSASQDRCARVGAARASASARAVGSAPLAAPSAGRRCAAPGKPPGGGPEGRSRALLEDSGAGRQAASDRKGRLQQASCWRGKDALGHGGAREQKGPTAVPHAQGGADLGRGRSRAVSRAVSRPTGPPRDSTRRAQHGGHGPKSSQGSTRLVPTGRSRSRAGAGPSGRSRTGAGLSAGRV